MTCLFQYCNSAQNLLVILDKKLDAILERLGKLEDRVEQAQVSSHKVCYFT